MHRLIIMLGLLLTAAGVLPAAETASARRQLEEISGTVPAQQGNTPDKGSIAGQAVPTEISFGYGGFSGKTDSWTRLPQKMDQGDGARCDLTGTHIACGPGVTAEGSRSALRGNFLIDGKGEAVMEAGRPSDWTFSFQDEEGHPITRFEREHGKSMHLIVVSQDMETFAHIHPEPGQDGVLRVRVNQEGSPDDPGIASAVSKAGEFLLFGELKPEGQESQEVRFTAKARGAGSTAALLPDPVLPSGQIRKFFKADGAPGKGGDAYRVDLKVERMDGIAHLNFRIQAAMDHGGETMYMDVKDLENWLGMPGHAVLIGAQGERVEDKVFKHLHASGGGHDGGHDPKEGDHGGGHGGSGSGKVSFMLEGEAEAGTYKVWGQFKRAGAVLTFPFVINLSATSPARRAS